LITARWPNRYDQFSANLQLLHQGQRQMVRRGGNNDGVIRGVFLPAVIAVTLFEFYAVVPQPLEPPRRLFCQFWNNFNAVNANVAHFGQNGSLISGAGADLQHLIARLDFHQFSHPCDDIGL